MKNKGLPPREITWEVQSNGCWICTSHQARQREYPTVTRTIDGKKQHKIIVRYLYEKKHGPYPPGLETLHICQNAWCINPNHIKPGTHKENMVMHTWSTKFTEKDILYIRNSVISSPILAKQYNTTTSRIASIRTGNTWAKYGGRTWPKRNRVLTPTERKEILHANGFYRKIADKYEITLGAVSRIKIAAGIRSPYGYPHKCKVQSL